jgi:hypothetical protein
MTDTRPVPYLITPPAGDVVPLATLKDHLRIDHDFEDSLVASYAANTVAQLDGWSGILGRAILPQTWAIDLPEGCHVLPMPDVTVATVDGEPVTVTPSPAGPMVDLADAATVQFTCAMSAQGLAAVRGVVMLAVAEAYEAREASAARLGPAMVAQIAALRWRRA